MPELSVLSTLSLIISVAMMLGGVGSYVWAMSRMHGLEISVTTMSSANRELRDEIAHEREGRHQDRLECAKENARLEGRVQVLTDGIGSQIAAAVIAAMHTPDRRATGTS